MSEVTLDIDALKTRPDAIRLFLDRVRFTKAGKEYKAKCCFHGDKTASLTLFQQDGVWLFKCFGCGKTGNCVQFVSEFDKISLGEAVEKVRMAFGDRVSEIFKPVVEDSTPKKSFSLEEYEKLEKALEENQEAQDWLRQERGIDYATAVALHLGYRQDVGKLAGGPNADIASGGWICFPRIRDSRVVGIHYRSMRRKAFVRQPQMATELFNYDAVDPLEPVYVTEGELDAAVLVQAGFHAVSLPNATSHLTPAQKDLLMQAEYVVLAGDTDAAGEACMAKLGAVLGDRCYLLRWPDGVKDANEYLMKLGDVRVFKTKVEELTALAKSQPMPGLYDLKAAMMGAGASSLADHPLRMKLPWREVDRMAILLPGSVTTVSATNTGQGKTAWVHQIALYNAMQHHEVVVNWQVELSADELAGMTVAHLARKDRNHLTPLDAKTAVQKMDGVKYYVGYDPTLTTVESVLDLLEAAVKRTGCGILILDHIHHLLGTADNEVQALSNAMQRLKRLAQTYMLKVIVVAQPRKANQASKGKSIHVTDLKGSEALASAADAVFTLHRDYTKNSDPNAPAKDEYDPITDVHLLKVRAKGDGAAQARLYFLGIHSTFLSLDELDSKKDLTLNEDSGMFGKGEN